MSLYYIILYHMGDAPIGQFGDGVQRSMKRVARERKPSEHDALPKIPCSVQRSMSEGGMIWLETLIELKCLQSSFGAYSLIEI